MWFNCQVRRWASSTHIVPTDVQIFLVSGPLISIFIFFFYRVDGEQSLKPVWQNMMCYRRSRINIRNVIREGPRF